MCHHTWFPSKYCQDEVCSVDHSIGLVLNYLVFVVLTYVVLSSDQLMKSTHDLTTPAINSQYIILFPFCEISKLTWH